MADAASMARSMWTRFEPIHAVTYFASEARSAFEQAGLRGFWRGYFAGRAAPLGIADGTANGAEAANGAGGANGTGATNGARGANAAVVTASFFNFAPAFVARAIPGVWELITPEDALRTRVAGAAEALRGLLAGHEAETAVAADLLWQAIGELDFSGRTLAAANAALPVPADDLARLWQAATVLREHRGDGHFAALAAADIDGCEAVVLRCGLDLRREDMQPVRGWTDEAWEAARARLADRGWVGPGGELTSAGRDAHDAVEDATDRAASRPWARLGLVTTEEIARVLTPLTRACARVLPYPSPIGLPRPANVGPSGNGGLDELEHVVQAIVTETADAGERAVRPRVADDLVHSRSLPRFLPGDGQLRQGNGGRHLGPKTSRVTRP